MKSVIGRSILIAAGLCAAGCSGSPVVVTEAQQGSTVTVKAGDAFQVRLHGNSTVNPPDNWQPESLPANVRLDGTDHESDSPGAMGAGGTTIFNFTAISAGTARLSFNSGLSQRRFAVTILAQ